MSASPSESGPIGTTRASRLMHALAASGALACALAVAAGAYTMHAALAPLNREFLGIAALFAFAHGLALAALAPAVEARLCRIGLIVVLAGMILFVGSLACAALMGVAATLAPIGGSLLILGWLLVSIGFAFG